MLYHIKISPSDTNVVIKNACTFFAECWVISENIHLSLQDVAGLELETLSCSTIRRHVSTDITWAVVPPPPPFTPHPPTRHLKESSGNEQVRDGLAPDVENEFKLASTWL